MKKDCNYILYNLSAFLDNELPEDDVLIIEKHLDSCISCQAELEKLSKISGLIQSSFKTSLDIPDFSMSIMQRLSDEKELSCTETKEDISVLHDDELDISRKFDIEEHIKSCDSCKKELLLHENLSNKIQTYVNNTDIDLWDNIEPQLISEGVCEISYEQISAYTDKELTKEETKIIAQHLLKCANCRKIFDGLIKTQKLINNSLLNNPKTPDYWKTIAIRIKKENSQATLLLSAVASLIMIALTWFSLAFIFPTEGNNYTAQMNYRSYNQNFESGQAYTSLKDAKQSDSYMFANTLDAPPAEIVPIMYGDTNGDAYEY